MTLSYYKVNTQLENLPSSRISSGADPNHVQGHLIDSGIAGDINLNVPHPAQIISHYSAAGGSRNSPAVELNRIAAKVSGINIYSRRHPASANSLSSHDE